MSTMPSPAQRLSLGPWPGGLNLIRKDEENDLGDSQAVVKALNVDFTDEGFVTSRAGCQRVGVKNTHYTDSVRECRVLGSIFEDGALQAVLGIVVSGTSTKIYLTKDGYTLEYWGSVAEPLSSVEQYVDTIYLIRSDTGTPTTGGFTIPVNFFTAGVPNAATSASIPSGDKTFLFKDRLFIVNKASSTIYFSAPTDPSVYDVNSGGGYFIINPANDVGTSINDVAITNETIYIFKRHTTYLFSYESNPNDDGVVRLINPALGAFSATSYENDVYVVNTGGIYRIVNGVFIQLDQPLNLRENADLVTVIDPTSLTRPLFIHAAAGRLLVGQLSGTSYDYGWNYVSMNLNTGAWSSYIYQSDGSAPGAQGTTAQPSRTWGMEIYPSKDRTYFMRIPNSRGAKDYTLDGRASNTQEKRYMPEFAIQTFSYNGGYSSVWKKLHRMMIRGSWVYRPGVYIEDLDINLVYDNNSTIQDTVKWLSTSPWESVRPQTEFKLAVPQHRFRNLRIEFNQEGQIVDGELYEVPPVGALIDSFNRSNGAAGSTEAPNSKAWNITGTAVISSNKLAISASSTCTANGGWIDTDIQATWSTKGATGALAGRFFDANNCVLATSTDIIEMTAGVPTSRASYSAIAAGSVVRMVIVGTTVRVYDDGVLVGTGTLTTQTYGTKQGFYEGVATTSSWDNFTVAGLDAPNQHEAYNEFYLTGIDMDISVPRGMSVV